MAQRFKDPDDELRIVLMRDMWLTGFDAPCMHTLYVDKPMRGHNLMQAIARVNRMYGDKPGGLIVDYLGVASFLKEAMSTYTQRGGQGDATLRQERAAEIMLEKLEMVKAKLKAFEGHEGLYNVRTLMGPLDHFPIDEARVLGSLDDAWVSWIGDAGTAPLHLAPMVRLEYRRELGVRQLMLPRTLELTPGKAIELCPLIGANTAKFPVPG